MLSQMRPMQALKVFLLCAVFSSGICDDLTNLAQGNPEIAQEPIASLDIATTSYETAFIKMLVALILILLLLMIGVFVYKKFAGARLQQSNHTRNIKILEKRAISPKTILYLVEIGGKKLLLGESQLELRHLSSLDWIDVEKKGL
jgi:flagellar biogenesis protein FliO